MFVFIEFVASELAPPSHAKDSERRARVVIKIQNPPARFDASAFLPPLLLNPSESYESTSSQPH